MTPEPISAEEEWQFQRETLGKWYPVLVAETKQRAIEMSSDVQRIPSVNYRFVRIERKTFIEDIA